MKIYTKEILIQKFKEIKAMGWIENRRHGNQGGIGNTIEDLLGIEENNLPLPNASEWELKSQRLNTTSLTTLFHIEPSPRALRFVPQILLLNYGWQHQEAGKRYPVSEMSFRQTINGSKFTDRGFGIKIDEESQKVLISFDHSKVSDRHSEWLESVSQRIGLGELDPQPYWGFDDLMHKAGTKLPNTFYIQAEVRRDPNTRRESYHYTNLFMLQKFSFNGFLNALKHGYLLIDFDARSGHNHGTKFRLRQNRFIDLYENVTKIF
ncbi:MAG: nciI [Candidatus Cloacimonas sp. SDB]|nr:MAG: nciI [Candidatus Cloacimonas sp. SDB]